MRKLLLIVTLLLVGACKEEVVHVGAAAPELAAVTLQGEPVKLANWQGQAIYLNFWSAGCGACIIEMKDLERLSVEYRGRVTVVAVNLDPQEMPIDGILSKQNVTYPVIRDSLMMTRERYRVVGTPTSFVIGADGIVRKMIIGNQKPEALAALFDDMAKGSVN